MSSMNVVTVCCVQMTKLTGELRVNEADSSGLTPLYFAVMSRKVGYFKLTCWLIVLQSLAHSNKWLPCEHSTLICWS